MHLKLEIHNFNLGVEACQNKDFKTAISMWAPLSDLGHSDAQNCLGALYDHGAGVKRDYYKAAELYKLSAKQGNALAFINLSSLYEHGHGVPKNIKLAKIFFNVAITY